MSICSLALSACSRSRLVVSGRRFGVGSGQGGTKVFWPNTNSTSSVSFPSTSFRSYFCALDGRLTSPMQNRRILCSAAVVVPSTSSFYSPRNVFAGGTQASSSALAASTGSASDWGKAYSRNLEIFLSSMIALATSALLVGEFRSFDCASKPTQAEEAAFADSPTADSILNSMPALGTGASDSSKSAAVKKKKFYYPYIMYAASVPYEGEESSGVERAIPAVSSGPRKASYDISVRALRGGRVTMEDEYFVANGGRFAAVFDGHGGGGVSQMLKKRLYDLVTQELQKHHQNHSDDDVVVANTSIHGTMSNGEESSLASSGAVGTAMPSVASHVAALRSAYERIDREVLEDDLLRYQGSTAVAVLVHETHYEVPPQTQEGQKKSRPSHQPTKKRTLLSANVGDSRAILSRRGRAIDLTRDHKPNEEREKARILSMGETIEWDRYCKVHRVRSLSLSRAIGDRYAKPVVSGEPDIKHFNLLEDGGDEFFLLASDGLWDVMTSQDAVDYIHDRMNEELRNEQLCEDDIESYRLVLRKNMAKFVAREAIRRGSGDNVCVLIVWLDDSTSSSN